jgi:3-carboxy-cis,cis-muconate cycloisomerase
VSDLFWPGAERAGSVMTDAALLDAMVAVEAGWLAALVAAGVARSTATDDLAGLVGGDDVAGLSLAAEGGGNPLIPLVELLRSRVSPRNGEAGRWLHRGLTSQDVLDTALMLCSRDALDRLLTDIGQQVTRLTDLANEHRSTLMVGRTLTQHAVPITFGLKVAAWLAGLLDAVDDLLPVRAALPVQAGGAAGTAAAATELARVAGATDPARAAVQLAEDLAARLGLQPAMPWHTIRRPVTRLGDVLTAVTDAFGRIANDVLLLSRPEIGELSEAAREGRGGSSTMPNKQNPVLSLLIRRAALSAPAFSAQLHTAAAESVDERSDGGWHAEWAALRSLTRMAVVASSQATELLDGLVVHADRMRARLESVAQDVLAEQRSMAAVIGESAATPGPEGYLGASDLFISAVLDRAASFGKDPL